MDERGLATMEPEPEVRKRMDLSPQETVTFQALREEDNPFGMGFL